MSGAYCTLTLEAVFAIALRLAKPHEDPRVLALLRALLANERAHRLGVSRRPPKRRRQRGAGKRGK